MADHPVPSQEANPVLANTYPHPHLAPHQLLHGQNPHVAGNYQEDVHREGVPQPAVVRGEMHYPPHIDVPNYNAAYYHPPPPPVVPLVPYVHMNQDDRVIEPVPAQAYAFAPGVRENHDGYGAHFPAVVPPEAYPGDRPYQAPPVDMPPAANGLRNLVGRFLNNPGTLVNMLRIEPGPNGRFEFVIVNTILSGVIFVTHDVVSQKEE